MNSAAVNQRREAKARIPAVDACLSDLGECVKYTITHQLDIMYIIGGGD
jgi:hypothetical protein